MSNQPILDENFLEQSAKPKATLFQKIVRATEIGLLALAAIGLFFKIESWEGGTEFLIIAIGLLVTLYVLLPIPLFGSSGWKRHVGAHVVGVILWMGLAGWLFRIESWEGGSELIILGFSFGAQAFIVCLIFYFLRKNSPRGNAFFLRMLIRLGVVLVMTFGQFLAAFS